MTTKIAMFTIDCADPAALASFYSELLGMDIAASGDEYAMLTGDGPALGFGQAEGYRAPEWPNQFGSKQYHLDLAASDVPATEAKALELGASLADPQPGDTWRVLLDPAGHPFCLTDASAWG